MSDSGFTSCDDKLLLMAMHAVGGDQWAAVATHAQSSPHARFSWRLKTRSEKVRLASSSLSPLACHCRMHLHMCRPEIFSHR